MDKVQQQVDTLYRQLFGKMVAALLCSSRDIDIDAAEDIVHDAFSSALTNWGQGIPANPGGWLYRVCRNNALNKIKKGKRLQPLTERAGEGQVEIKFDESAFDDQQLQLLFACAHPDLSPKAQVVITLKYVVSLKVEAIANILGMTVDGVDKLLVRARQKIKEENILLAEPHAQALLPRLPIVHKIIYLAFNEGYKTSGRKEIIREELCGEALLLAKALMDSGVYNKDTEALYALMLFNSARFKARFTPYGELLDLENQDRLLWNHDLIELGHRFFTQSQCEAVSTYHLEAAIACVHCTAKSFALTDWKTIAGLYARLLHSNPNPFVELNYAIVLYYAGDKQAAFAKLNLLRQHAFLSQYYLLNMALGKLHHLEDDDFTARQFLLKAYGQTNAAKEKQFIQKMIDGLK